MCPACIGTMVMIAASALPTGGLAAFIGKKVEAKTSCKSEPSSNSLQENLKEE